MTRINCVPVDQLTGKHLIAEYRELPRVFGLVAKAIQRGETPDDKRNPERYTLGAGHVRFFYPRLMFLCRRFHQLADEMIARGYAPKHRSLPPVAREIPGLWWGDWHPTTDDLSINRARIAERLNGVAS